MQQVKSTEATFSGSAKEPFINGKSQAGEESDGTSLIPTEVLDTEGFWVIVSHCLQLYTE